MQHSKNWVLVANGTVARIFELHNSHMRELQVLTHPETRLHGHELMSDGPGTVFSSAGHKRSPIEPRMSPQKNEADHFAAQLAKSLDEHHRRHEFGGIHVIAAPAFLGLLRSHFSVELRKSVLTEVDRDLVDETPAHIRSYLP
jgi:protein required for attachment to host cells